MFKCNVCNMLSLPKEPVNKKVVLTRNVEYNNKLYDKEKEKEYVKVSQGWEIVKEINVCSKCK